MKFINKVLWSIVISFVLLQVANAFQLEINPNYFDNTNINPWNWAEVQFTDDNIWYWAFFIWSWINTNTTLKIGNRQINCKKKLNWYYTMLFTNFLMFWIDPETASTTKNSLWLTPDTTFNWAWLYYDCVGVGSTPININQNLKWVYWWVEWTYWSGNWINTGAIRAGIHKDAPGVWKRDDTSKLEVVLSTSTWYASKTLSWKFIGSVAYHSNLTSNLLIEDSNTLWTQRILYTWYVIPRPIWDIRINNAEKYESGVFVIPYENYQNPWIDISVVTSKPNISTNVVITWQYEKNNSQTGIFSSPRYLTSLSTTASSITVPGWHLPENDIAFTWAYWYYWYKNIKFVHYDYRHLSWTLTLNIWNRSRSINFRVEGGEPCLSWRDNDYFITPDFWIMNKEKGGPTKSQIKCAIFWYEDTLYNESNWAGYNTAYTKWWSNYNSNSCTNITVETVSSLPSTLSANTIYVLTNTWVNLPNNINVKSCSAIISKTNVEPIAPGSLIMTPYYWRDTTLNKTITIDGNNVVLDNISIKWNWFSQNQNWIKIDNNKKNITLNVVKVYNNNIWIRVSNSSNSIILNNIQSFNNNIWIQQDTNSNKIAINNSQIYRNNKWIIYNKSTNNILYNSSIYQNNRWIEVINWSNNNTFDHIAIYDNNGGFNGENIFIQEWLSNIWNHVELTYGSENNITVNEFERISGFYRIVKGNTEYLKREYKCKWWTEWVCRVNTPNGPNTKYYCTWSITETYVATKKNFNAIWTYLWDNTRTLSISNESFANFDMNIINEMGAEEWSYNVGDDDFSHIQYLGNIELRRNVDRYTFSWQNIYWELIPLTTPITINWTTYTYNVNITYSNASYPEIMLTGYWNEKINYKIVSWTANNHFWVWDLMCEHDWWIQRWIPRDDIRKKIIDGGETKTHIFTSFTNTGEINCSWANCLTNPKLSWWSDPFLIHWTDYYFWNKWEVINVTDYSYWIGLKRQQDVLLPWWTAWWKVKHKWYFWWYFIWSNVPAQGIERSDGSWMKVLSKIHYTIWWRTTNGSYGNKFDIISFTERWFPAWTINTITSYTEWPRSSRPNQTWQQIRNSHTNIFTWLTAGSYTELYLRPWDTNHYPVVLQTYSDKYYATHRWMTRLGRENIKYKIEPEDLRCLAPTTEGISTKLKWLTHANEWIAFNYEKHPLVWANVTWAKQSNISVTRNRTNGTIHFDNIDSEKWAIKMDFTIPCTAWDVCSATVRIINPNIIKDILEFPSHGGAITYSRDMKWPDIMISATWAVECRDTTLRLKLNDNCIWASWFMISGFFNTWWLTLETSTWWNEEWYDIIIDSWSVGRTWKDANGQALHRTWIIYTRDKYNNETTGFVDIIMTDVKVTITTWKTISWALDILDWERIEEHNRSTWINVVELYWVTEWEYCWIQDLYLTWFKCFNYKNDFELWTENRALTWHMAGHILTISPRQETDYYTYQSWIICAINISDNEKNSVTWYMIFNINTVHKPHLFEEPVIIWWTKYSEYSWTEYLNYTYSNWIYENINTWKNNNYENQKYLSWEYSKYSSWGTISIYLWNINKYVKMYHVSCTGFYTGTNTTYWNTIPDSKIIEFNGIENIEDCGTWQIKWLNVSIWNWWENGNNEIFGNNLDQFATGITDFIFYDSILPNVKNSSIKTNKLIITNWHTVKQDRIRVQDPENNAVDIRPNVPWYTSNSYILNTWIINLRLSWWTILDSNISAMIKWWLYLRNRMVEITWTIKNDTTDDIYEEQIYLNIWTGLLRDFSQNPSEQNDTETRYRYTSKNPIYIENSRRWQSNSPESDISILWVKIDSGVIDTWWLSFRLSTAKPINGIGDIECSLYKDNIWWFKCTDIVKEEEFNQERTPCTTRNTSDSTPRCTDRNLSTDGYNYTLIKDTNESIGKDHRRTQMSRRYKISFEVYSWEENSWYYNQHTWEREFFTKISIKDEDKIFNDTYAVIEVYENKTPFKEWLTWSEKFFYWDLISALGNWSWDNWFMFYISWPQKINKWNINSWVIWDISYEIEFSEPVADEFYYITWESIVNKFKKTLFIKRPTYNFANPKSYLFNFPDYEWYE